MAQERSEPSAIPNAAQRSSKMAACGQSVTSGLSRGRLSPPGGDRRQVAGVREQRNSLESPLLGEG